MVISWWCRALSILLVASLLNFISSAKDDSVFCESIIRNWAESATGNKSREDKMILKDLLFFLHVPRTGGRTYFHCFLRKLYNSEQECPRSYDKLRFNPSKTNCHLMATHDDYSLMSRLSKEQTSVVTILRNPIDRIFSTYEFSVEVAARFLVHPNLTTLTRMSMRLRPKSREISTLDIWPWKYLVPWMREDLFARRDARKYKEVADIKEAGDPYNMEEIAMPLFSFINDPISHDIIHNGATFQLAGLTNNSCLAEARKVRHCVRQHPTLGHYIVEVAKKRLDDMLYVGLTEDHRKSAALFASMVGSQVLSKSESLGFNMQKDAHTSELFSSSPRSKSAISVKAKSNVVSSPVSEAHTLNDIKAINRSMTAEKLMEVYEDCVSALRNSQLRRRNMSLQRIAPVKFSKKARESVPHAVLEQMIMLNSLDMELYKYAQGVFKQQFRHLKKSMILSETGFTHSEGDGNMDHISHGYFGWDDFLLRVGVILIILVFYLYLAARRRSSKLKV